MDGAGGIDVDTISRFCFFGGFGSVSYPTPLPPLSSLPSFFLWDQFIHSFIHSFVSLDEWGSDEKSHQSKIMRLTNERKMGDIAQIGPCYLL